LLWLCKIVLLLLRLYKLLLLRLEKLRLECPLSLLRLGLLGRLRKHIYQVLHTLVLLWHGRGLEIAYAIILYGGTPALSLLEATKAIHWRSLGFRCHSEICKHVFPFLGLRKTYHVLENGLGRLTNRSAHSFAQWWRFLRFDVLLWFAASNSFPQEFLKFFRIIFR